ncbi:hypothetical protein F4777DRAFT_14843 [Nemania sp. FL0916]|nr:hypothetical protein F4777DRAFT_14843 [Nemania sp. FL0916]
MAENYILRVTAGSDYDIAHHVVVPVNTPETVAIRTDLIDAEVTVRVKNYTGLPRNSPATSDYFEIDPHKVNNDQYSIALRFMLKQPKEERRGTEDRDGDGGAERVGEDEARGVSGHDLQFGNDFDHPIRDRLPPGFSYAMSIVKWWVDPGLEGDAYADKPYLYGPALSSFNIFHVGSRTNYSDKTGVQHFEEGGDEHDGGLQIRKQLGVPDDAAARQKWALKKESKDRWTWEFGRTYSVDFFNPYLDFEKLALKLPKFELPIVGYWDGQGLRHSHALRYVLRNRATGDVYLVIVFSLYLKEDVNEDGSLKPSAALGSAHQNVGSITDSEEPREGQEVGGAKADGAAAGDDDVD